MNTVCAHRSRTADGYLRCDRPAQRKAWRHRNVPDLHASWLCWKHWYRDYLESGQWDFTRRRKLAKAGRRCERCGNSGYLHVHHKTYANVGREDLDDLEVLCSVCHEQHHRIAVQ